MVYAQQFSLRYYNRILPVGKDLQWLSSPTAIFAYKKLWMFSPESPALLSRYAQYLPVD